MGLKCSWQLSIPIDFWPLCIPELEQTVDEALADLKIFHLSRDPIFCLFVCLFVVVVVFVDY